MVDDKKKELEELVRPFEGMPDRFLKYFEIMLRGSDASPRCFQDTMSYRRLALELTTYCNLNCAWCYRRDSSYKHILNKTMPFEMLEKIVNNTRGKFRMVHLGGLGEPFLYPRMMDAIRLVRKLSDNVKVTTNGLLLTEEKVDAAVKAGLTHIEFSVDAFGSGGDFGIDNALIKKFQIRTTKPQLVKIMKYIGENTPLHLQVNAVVNSMTYDSLMKAVEALKDVKGLNRLHLIPLFITEGAKKSDINRLTEKKFRALLLSLKKDIERYGLKWELDPSPFGTRADPVIEMKKQKNICFTCFEDPYISVEGKLLPCGRQKEYGGADATQGLEKAINDPKLVDFRKKMLEGRYPPLCGRLCYLKDNSSRN